MTVRFLSDCLSAPTYFLNDPSDSDSDDVYVLDEERNAFGAFMDQTP